MAKWNNDNVLDKGLEWIRDNVDRMILCSAQPATYAEANATYDLADVALTSGSGGDMTIDDGDVTGRKITIAAKNNVDIDHAGDGSHVALVDDAAGGTLVYVTTLNTTKTGLQIGDKVNFPAWDIEIRDVTV